MNETDISKSETTLYQNWSLCCQMWLILERLIEKDTVSAKTKQLIDDEGIEYVVGNINDADVFKTIENDPYIKSAISILRKLNADITNELGLDEYGDECDTLKKITEPLEVLNALGGDISGDYSKDIIRLEAVKCTCEQRIYDGAYQLNEQP